MDKRTWQKIKIIAVILLIIIALVFLKKLLFLAIIVGLIYIGFKAVKSLKGWK